MITETIELPDGVLSLTREGRKLVKVKYSHQPRSEFVKTHYALVALSNCEFCGAYIEESEGYWLDLAENGICNLSPTTLHGPEPI